MPTLTDLAAWLGRRLQERESVWRPAPSQDAPQVRRLVLALEPGDLPPTPPPGEGGALFVHRAFRLGKRWPAWPVLTSHDGFDRALTTGENPALAARLGWAAPRTLHWKGAVTGMVADPGLSWPDLIKRLDSEFGGHEALIAPADPGAAARVAVMNAMRPELLREVHAQGIGVYVTGQLRPGAVDTARDLGLGVVALGHRRSEVWGLHQLARELRADFPELETTVAATSDPS
ncbi:Nif3-like dinuclear metal center hexameric protein [Deinococcus sp. Leaf326]|uniref:Nif3-like dinuclear metal center hexameric protein n=1 Tax=Deinococcus sp. Leaf326 TaxID=1736338 RepID=UPI0006F4F37A|nr:Nif3-like dinuclear metal center hexameric protein [Deinococcus sp. Leaf326]KQR22948.1 hypothetical protein ASF71_07235 [Deinococcus sp. Leaf326]